MTSRIDSLKAPLLVSWQMTRECDLACLHCCTDSAPGKALADELDAEEAARVARDLVRSQVPYVMLCGGEPLVVPHFFAVAEILGEAGIHLKIESNGQQLDAAVVARLARLPIRSVQISLDADTQAVYGQQRPGGRLDKAHAACRAVRAADLPLEVTFAPTRINIHEAQAVIERAVTLGAFRFNTGKLMRIGTAARLWHKLAPTAEQYQEFRTVLDASARRVGDVMRLCYAPFSIEESLCDFTAEAPATMLVLPNGKVKVAAALPYLCADLRRQSMTDAWDAYRSAWRDEAVMDAIRRASDDDSRHAQANAWQSLPVSTV
ncbi:MAG: radical SAM protein [Gammaproteobacteria bacterium]|nr:radical SAM protein [Gammaproteobacteria bacterium]MDX2459752.1 radical SAM protein [Gammaproteobacteria bacterium]